MMWLERLGRVAKGAPSGIAVSLLVHVAILIAAGFLIVRTIFPPEEVIVVPPEIHKRPIIEPKKIRPRIQKNAKPEATQVIVANVQKDTLPDFQLPALIGTDDALKDGIGLGSGDFMELPEIGENSTLGTTTSIGNDIVGTFYDFKRDRLGRWIHDAYPTQEFLLLVNRFMESGWRDSSLAKYYRAPRKLYAQCLVVPPTYSSVGPSAFDTDDAAGGSWVVHYKGKLVHKDGITFRFVCSADFFTVIRVNNEIVWAGIWNTPKLNEDYQVLAGGLYSPRTNTREGFMGHDRCMKGEWITLEPGMPKDIDIIIGDENGACGFMIAVEEQGVEYEQGPQGYPIYPIFRTAALSHDMLDAIYKDLPAGEVCVTNGPIFSDI